MPARSSVVLALSALAILAHVGCAGATDPATDPQHDEAATGDDAELRAKKCGGIAGLGCPTGYHCLITATHPDAMGTCKKNSATPSCATMKCPAGQQCMVMGTPPAPMCM